MQSEPIEAESLCKESGRGAGTGDIPVPPTLEVRCAQVREQSTEELVETLREQGPAGREGGYWVLRQGPASADSQRESLVNLDSDAALAAALSQVFFQDEAPESVRVQWLPGRRAAGVLFTRHPVRQDLAHMVVEGVVETAEAEQERLIFHEDGTVAYRHPVEGALLQEVGAQAFLRLGTALRCGFERPQACEWVFDGQTLWMMQTLPVGSLPVPEEAWCRRVGFGIWNQAVSPLWYTLAGRWLKTGFWRVRGEQLGWQDLHNMEPYRRLHGHIYTNSLFFARLLEEQDCTALREAVPPAWRPRQPGPVPSATDWRLDRLYPWSCGFRLRLLERRLGGLEQRIPEALDAGDGTWRLLMKLDAVGEELAALEGWLACIALPRWLENTAEEVIPLTRLVHPDEIHHLRELGLHGGKSALPETTQAELSGGADPVFPRGEHGIDALGRGLDRLPGERRARLAGLSAAPPGAGTRLLHWRARARVLRERLGADLRTVLEHMGASLMQSGRLERGEDVHFLYFDELWQLWQQSGQGRSAPRGVGERKLRYMANAWHGAPDWVIDQVAYGVRVDQTEHPALDGRGLVPGRVSGRIRRIYSGWALEEVEQGDILVLDQCETCWLPWLSLAGALVLANRDPLDPAAALARALEIPAVAGVDDAMHCLVDDAQAELDGEAGTIRTV